LKGCQKSLLTLIELATSIKNMLITNTDMGKGVGEREGTSSNRANTSKGIETHKKQKNSRNTILHSSYGDLVNTEFLKMLHGI